jgi:hypothetical protein
MNLPNRGRRERLAIVADPAASAALLPAAAEPRIEQLEHLGVHLGKRELTEGRLMWVSILDRYPLRVLASTSETSSQRSSTMPTVALERGCRRSSTWLSSRVRTSSASRAEAAVSCR